MNNFDDFLKRIIKAILNDIRISKEREMDLEKPLKTKIKKGEK